MWGHSQMDVKTKHRCQRETGRKGAGGKAQQQQANGNKAANGASRRGRSRSRRANSRVRGRSASKNRAPLAKKEPKSREELDSELDQYMANTRTLDKEMEEYINGTGSSRI
ncbi:AGAP001438-PB-like protein [Anopheles sinensis]|uniref:AGAP001438-PB-like protein n=1 Tax=Anopheles sinensis TaxID=74873 RepID=A0A084VTU3_ANOSI|nr:AGAP001438-PB-like protein [Anopheles sinensis]